MRDFALVLCLALASVVLLVFVRDWREIIAVRGHAALMAGQAFQIENSVNVEVEVRSQFPVSIRGVNCDALRQVSQDLYCGPGPIRIQDFRPSLLIWAQTNHVDWKVTQTPDR